MMKSNKLVWLLPIRSIAFLLLFVVLKMIMKQDFNDISNWWSLLASGVNLVFLLGMVVYMRKHNIKLSSLIKNQHKTSKTTILGVTMMMLLLGIGGMYLAGFVFYGEFPYLAPMMIAPIPVGIAIINVFILPITTACAEEGLYLGCGVSQIQNKYCAILIPAFFFALQHCFIPFLPSVDFMLYRFFSFLPLTLIICWYYHKKRKVLPILIGHTVIDVATVFQILMTSLYPEMYFLMLG